MKFVNTLPYLSNPIEEFSDFRFVSWEKEIYPKFKGGSSTKELVFFTDFIKKKKIHSIIDFGVGGGSELSGIYEILKNENYPIKTEANEVDEAFISQASRLFKKKRQNIKIHKANWIDLPDADPSFSEVFDFGFLTGNSLTYIGGGTRPYTKKAQQIVVDKFSKLIKKGGYLFIDTRNYDYIRSLMNLPKERIFENFTFDYSVYYHGFKEKIIVFPAYISDTVVVLHYYNREDKTWSKLDLYPIYQRDIEEILSKKFKIIKKFHDFKEQERKKSLFVQYLVKKK